MKVIAAVMVGFALVSTPGLAWSYAGPRAEVRLGVDVAGTDLWEKFDYNDGYYRLNDERSISLGDSGFSYGLGAGYDFAIGGRLVAGVEATLDFSNAKSCVSGFYQWEDFCLKADRDIGLGIRAGAVVTPSTLFFVKAGYANGRVKSSGWNVLRGRSLSEEKTRDGLRIGGGLETALSSRVYLKVEYSYTDYSGWDEHFEERYILKHDASFGFDRHKTLAAVGMRF